jgi:error-prone DNA polymerase
MARRGSSNERQRTPNSAGGHGSSEDERPSSDGGIAPEAVGEIAGGGAGIEDLSEVCGSEVCGSEVCSEVWGFGDWETVRKRGYLSPGARKEQLRKRDYRKVGSRRPEPYCELHAASSFSFLRGSSQPEDLIERAAECGLPAIALLDRGGVYGAPRFFKAAKAAGIRALVGAEVVLETEQAARSAAEQAARSAAEQAARSAAEHAARSAAEREARNSAADRRPPAPLGPTSTPGSGASDPGASDSGASPRAAGAGRPKRNEPGFPETRLALLVQSRTGYRNLCRLITAGALRHPKGEARVSWEDLEAHAEGLWCLAGCGDDPVRRGLEEGGIATARRELDRLRSIFGGERAPRLHVELQRHGLRDEEHRNRALVSLAGSLRLPLVATNGVRYARGSDKPLFDVMTAIRHHTTIDDAGALLAPERGRQLEDARAMAERFADLPRALHATHQLAAALDFTLEDLGYQFPDYPLPPGETPISYLRQLTWNGALARFRPLTAKTQRQLEHELALIEKLDLAGYFLIVWDIVRFCLEQGILCQGRGSAANSAVCYALRITAIDPVRMDLLFERFLSEQRGEWPDIDLDLPSGDQREKVIQYVYGRYGVHGSAMTANVVTYRDRMAAREVAKALGYSPQQVDQLAKRLGSWHYDLQRGDRKQVDAELVAAGFDPSDSRLQLFVELWKRLQNHPRHLGQHSGGMVMSKGRLDEVVPLEPAAMEDRVIVQWDKDDCADLGIIKVDLLGLGMLNALEEAVPLINAHERADLDLAHLPPDDPETYAMIRRADTVGTFQIESRAQMASLPRNRPERFYDLVIQVAIIRPGPIVGNLANPFFERRLGREPVTYPDESLKPVLERTLGVPIFQEQILKLAMVAAGFSGGEAEELRRAMGFKRSMERMESIERRLREGMTERGLGEEAQRQIIQAITSFALYGFPESHAASFALIAYASAYLKRHHPNAFFLSLLNAWPMGFYHPATLVKEAQRAGVEVVPIDVNASGWRCRYARAPRARERDEPVARACSDRPPGRPIARSAPAVASAGRDTGRYEGEGGGSGGRDEGEGGGGGAQDVSRDAGAFRLGLRFVKGLRQEAGETIEREQARRRFDSTDDLVARCRLRADEASALAEIGALASLPGITGRRAALWQVARAARPRGPLLARLGDEVASPLPEMTLFEQTAADFRVSTITTGPHPMSYLRAELERRGIVPAAELPGRPDGHRLKTAGSVVVRQRPGTARGLLFLTLEDETGMCQAVVMPDVLQANRSVLIGAAGLIVEGILQKRDGTLSVKGDRFWALDQLSRVPSHDFR